MILRTACNLKLIIISYFYNFSFNVFELRVSETTAKVCRRVRGDYCDVSLGSSIILTHPQTTPRWLFFYLFWFYE